METEDIYVLRYKPNFGGGIVKIADDFEYLNMMLADYTAIEQDRMTIDNYDLFRVKGKGD